MIEHVIFVILTLALIFFHKDVIVEFDPVAYGPVVEGPQTSVSFRIVTRAPPARAITVLFSTRSQSATGNAVHCKCIRVEANGAYTYLAALDFAPRTRFPVRFEAGDSEELVEVAIINDGVYEGEEQFEGLLELQSGSSGVELGQQTLATAIIRDDDGT